MEIAIIGWGSLIWDSRDLKIDLTGNNGEWYSDGPFLPIEFARISSDGRLTLVISKNSEELETFYALSDFKAIDKAIFDLATREKCNVNFIGSYDKSTNLFSNDNFEYKANITNWIINKPELDAVIWTNLSMLFKNKIGLKHNSENVIKYLESLHLDIKDKAEEYIRKTPSKIDTKIRRDIEKTLNWHKF